MLATLKWIGYTLISILVLCMVTGVVILVGLVVAFGGVFFAGCFAIFLGAFAISELFNGDKPKPAD